MIRAMVKRISMPTPYLTILAFGLLRSSIDAMQYYGEYPRE